MTGCWMPAGTVEGRGSGLRLAGAGSMLGELLKAVLERALEAELTALLGYEKHDLAGHNFGNFRNGQTVRTDKQ
jgi:putative transposase